MHIKVQNQAAIKLFCYANIITTMGKDWHKTSVR